MIHEEWRPINEYPNYAISNLGRVRNVKTGKLLRPVVGHWGYVQVTLFNEFGSKNKKIHRLVLEAFSNNSEDLEINHINGNKQDNALSNLEWCTKSENIAHAYKQGLKHAPHRKRVMIVETGEIFDSLTDCARCIEGSHENISRCLSGRLNKHKGYHFKEV